MTLPLNKKKLPRKPEDRLPNTQPYDEESFGQTMTFSESWSREQCRIGQLTRFANVKSVQDLP
jgi:hypothetical protein